MALTYLGGDRIQGLSSDTKPTNVPTFTRFEETDTGKIYHYYNDIGRWIPLNDTPNAGWVELGRSTLGSENDDVDVTSLPNKRYYMILGDIRDGTGDHGSSFRFNNDTGTSYAVRRSVNGNTDNTNVNLSTSGGYLTDVRTTDNFNVGFIANYTTKEKLWINNNIERNTTGAANVPTREEGVGKWTNTTTSINRIGYHNWHTGDYGVGTEIVVLGYDPSDTHTNNFWQPLADVTLGASGDNLSSGTITAKKYLWIQYYKKRSGDCIGLMTFNNDTGSNYAHRISDNGGADSTSASRANLEIATSASYDEFANIFIINVSTKEKLVIGHIVGQNTAGAGNAPTRREIVGKWTNTSNSITEIDLDNVQAGSFDAGSFIKVWGAD